MLWIKIYCAEEFLSDLWLSSYLGFSATQCFYWICSHTGFCLLPGNLIFFFLHTFKFKSSVIQLFISFLFSGYVSKCIHKHKQYFWSFRYTKVIHVTQKRLLNNSIFIFKWIEIKQYTHTYLNFLSISVLYTIISLTKK